MTSERRLSLLMYTTVISLLASGDINPNPGPVRNPCSVCSRPVARTHRSIQCDDCRYKCHINFGIGDCIIQSENHVKLLGVEFDKKLKFDIHVSNICKRAARQLNALKRLTGLLNTSSRLMIFRSFLLSNFNYCPLVWHFCGAALAGRLEGLQERGLRFVFNDRSSSYSALLARASLSTLSTGRLRSLAIEVYKALSGLGPSYSQLIFTEQVSERNSRFAKYLNQPNFKRITFGKNSLRYLGVKIWNGLPNNIKNAVTLNEFKRLISVWHFHEACGCVMCNE